MTNENQEKTNENNSKKSWSSYLASKSIALIVLAVVVVGAYLYLHYTVKAPAATQAQAHQRQKPNPPQVNVIKVAAQSIAITPQFLGHAEASKTVQIRARIQGFLQNRDFNEGTKVKKGDLLYKIDPRQYKADLAQAKATLESGKAQLSYAQAQWDRYKKLRKENAVTQSEVQNWESKAKVAGAQIAQSKAQIQQAKLNLSYTNVTAPMTGMIGKSQKYEGAYLDAGSNSLLTTMWKVDPIYVTIEVDQDKILKWRKLVQKSSGNLSLTKLPVALTLSDGSAYPYKGTVNFVNVTVNSQTSTAQIRATVANPKHILKPGQFLQVELQGIKLPGAILIPRSAVLQNPASSAVYIVDSNNKVKISQVELGNWQGNQWVIKSGIKPGDKVLVNHLMKVAPGMEVSPKIITAKQALKEETKQSSKPQKSSN